MPGSQIYAAIKIGILIDKNFHEKNYIKKLMILDTLYIHYETLEINLEYNDSVESARRYTEKAKQHGIETIIIAIDSKNSNYLYKLTENCLVPIISVTKERKLISYKKNPNAFISVCNNFGTAIICAAKNIAIRDKSISSRLSKNFKLFYDLI